MNFILLNIGTVIIPTDFHSMIFQRGRAQPPTSIDFFKNCGSNHKPGTVLPSLGVPKKNRNSQGLSPPKVAFPFQELSLPETVPGGMAAYRQTLAARESSGVERTPEP